MSDVAVSACSPSSQRYAHDQKALRARRARRRYSKSACVKKQNCSKLNILRARKHGAGEGTRDLAQLTETQLLCPGFQKAEMVRRMRRVKSVEHVGRQTTKARVRSKLFAVIPVSLDALLQRRHFGVVLQSRRRNIDRRRTDAGRRLPPKQSWQHEHAEERSERKSQSDHPRWVTVNIRIDGQREMPADLPKRPVAVLGVPGFNEAATLVDHFIQSVQQNLASQLSLSQIWSRFVTTRRVLNKCGLDGTKRTALRSGGRNAILSMVDRSRERNAMRIVLTRCG